MKNLLKIGAVIFVIALIAVACSKDQKVVRQLEGTWETTNYTVDGAPVDKSVYSGMEFTFEKCKVKKEDCGGNVSMPDPTKGEITFNMTYSISDKGETFTYTLSLPGIPAADPVEAEIVEQSKDIFVFSYDDEDGHTNEMTLEPK